MRVTRAECRRVQLLPAHDNLRACGDTAGVDGGVDTTAATEDILVDMAFDKRDERSVPGGIVRMILGQVAGTIDIVDVQGACSPLQGVDDNGNLALDVAVEFAAAIDTANGATLEDDSDIATSTLH